MISLASGGKRHFFRKRKRVHLTTSQQMARHEVATGPRRDGSAPQATVRSRGFEACCGRAGPTWAEAAHISASGFRHRRPTAKAPTTNRGVAYAMSPNAPVHSAFGGGGESSGTSFLSEV